MTQIEIKGDIANIKYSLEGLLRIISYTFLFIFVIAFVTDKFHPVLSLVGIIIFLATTTYRVETVINRSTSKINHRLNVLGLSFRNSFNIDDVKLVSIMHRGYRVPPYPILWLRKKNGKKYKIGEFIKHDDAEVVRELMDFCKIGFEGYQG